jgi:hypothetical protein
MLVCDASFADKIAACFGMFDFDELGVPPARTAMSTPLRQAMPRAGLMLMLRACCQGLAAMCGEPQMAPGVKACERAVKVHPPPPTR